MTNSIVLVENECYGQLLSSQQYMLESACRRIPGARLWTLPTVEEFFASNSFHDGVLVVPVILPSHQKKVEITRSVVKAHLPTRRIFGVVFVLFTDEKKFQPTLLGEKYWIEMLDEFYDQAVPTQFVVIYRDPPQVQQFHLAATLSGVFRDFDNLREIRKLDAVVQQLVDQVDKIEEEVTHVTQITQIKSIQRDAET